MVQSVGEAWIYSNPDPRYVCGASMCYWRTAWESCPFDDAPHEDRRWWLKNAAKCVGMSAINRQLLCDGETSNIGTPPILKRGGPRMVCRIHGANSEGYSRADMLAGGGGNWRRAAEWDEYCGKVCAL